MLSHARTIASILKELGFYCYNQGYETWSYKQGKTYLEVNYNAWQRGAPFNITVKGSPFSDNKTGMYSLVNPSVEEVQALFS